MQGMLPRISGQPQLEANHARERCKAGHEAQEKSTPDVKVHKCFMAVRHTRRIDLGAFWLLGQAW